jgi:polysaccharide deacetylase family protein (PEP-CTERM system associated)
LISHFFTVDVEEYFHVNAFEPWIARSDWSQWPLRLPVILPTLLDLLDRYEARGTFFVLGWVADHMPAVVRSIASRGHEVASHGYWHRRVNTLSPAEFAEELRMSKQSLESITGVPVLGYRAPSFSLVPGTEWAFDVLLAEGYRYDSSIFPVRRRGYGYPGAPADPYLVRRGDGTIAEYPLATTRVGRVRLPAAGGGYLRHLPFAFIRRAFANAVTDHRPATFYIHPWELDPDQPRVPVSLPTRLRHYRGLGNARARVERLLHEFRFTAIASHLPEMERAST